MPSLLTFGIKAVKNQIIKNSLVFLSKKKEGPRRFDAIYCLTYINT